MLELGAFVALGLLAAVGLTCLVELVAGGMLRGCRRMVTVVLATADCRGQRGLLRALDMERQNRLVSRVVVLDCGAGEELLEELRRWASDKGDTAVCRPEELAALLGQWGEG